jgi:hypothetical protein
MAATRQNPRQIGLVYTSGGAVAQLGERLVRNEEVRGSTPLGSTRYRLGFPGFSPSGLVQPKHQQVGLSQRWHSEDGHGDHSTTQICMAGANSTPRPSGKSGFYADCAKHAPAFAHAKPEWRLWLPLLALFTGMRPNEAAQLHAADLKQTEKGTWYLDIEATTDEDEAANGAAKTLKTATSRRKIPLHSELIKIGFVQFVEHRKKSGLGPRLFPDLKPDTYGNHATYALKRFRETYLPEAIKMESRQSFYSFRHSWRDALRRIDAPPATLAAVGGWSHGKLTSDDYGDKADPDYQAQIMEKISFPELDPLSTPSEIQIVAGYPLGRASDQIGVRLATALGKSPERRRTRGVVASLPHRS